MDKKTKIGIIGAGQMGEALIRGMLKCKVISSEQISTSDKNKKRLEEIRKKYRIRAYTDNSRMAEGSDILILSVKPRDMVDVLTGISSALRERTLLISIAAGVRVKLIHNVLGRQARVIRIMPNIAVLAGQGISALFFGPGADKEDEAVALQIFGSVGKTVLLKDEALMDAVTGLSGSGPAYIFLILEALSDAGVRMGLGREAATSMAIQTALGSAILALTTGKSLSELKEMVTSPGGTTLEGLKELEKRGVRAAFMEAVEAATLRARKLSAEICLKGGK